jgi:hypothetical protein
MKKCKSSAYLIVSSCHVGMTDEIVRLFAKVAKHFKAKTLHLGPTVTDQEYNRYERLKKRLAKIEERWNYDLTEAQEERLHENLSMVEGECKALLDIEKERVKTLTHHFGKVTFITNESISLEKVKGKGVSYVDGSMKLCKHLLLSPVPPTTPRATRNPMPAVSINYLKDCDHSWIVAHPVPYVDSLAKPGLNQAHNYFTVGTMMDQRRPLKTNEQYMYGHMPAAVFVIANESTGEFHPTQLHIDYLKKSNAGKQKPVILFDGLMFSDTGVREVKATDKATASFDDHVPNNHPGQLGAVRALNILHRPGTLINGGDACDFESINRHAEGLPGQTEGLRLSDDLRALRRLLDAQANVSSITHKVLIDSNHHEWVTRLVRKNPALIGMVDWPTLADEMFFDWNVIIRKEGKREIFYFGDFPVRHGDEDGGVKKAERIYPHGKYLGGHLHRFMAFRRSIMVGCGSLLAPEYCGNQVNAWQSQMTSLTKFNGVTAVAPKIVLHDKKRKVSRFSYRDAIYEVERYSLDEE